MSHESELYLTNPKPRLLYQSWGLITLILLLQQFSCSLASHPVTPLVSTLQQPGSEGIDVETDICVASPGPDSLMLRGSVELAWTLLTGHLMLQDNYGLYMDIESTW